VADPEGTPAPYRYAAMNLAEQGFGVFCPCVMDIVVTHGRKVPIGRAVFPGYLFVAFNDEDNAWKSINYTRGVVHLLPLHSEIPIAVPGEFIERMREISSPTEAAEAVVLFAENEVVRIIAGPFAGYVGRVLDSRAGATRVQIPLFAGREVPVTVGTKELEKVKNYAELSAA